MRLFLLALSFAAFLSACKLPGQESATGSGGSDGGGGGDGHQQTACEQASANCNECFSCAAQGNCSELAQACNNDPGCSTIDQCVQVCEGDADCETECAYSSTDEGIDLYERALGCVYCTECGEICAGRVVCG